MKKVVIFGAGYYGQKAYLRLKEKNNVIFFVDNNPNIAHLDYVRILPPSVLTETDFDLVYIAAVAGFDSIYKQLTKDLRIPASKINCLYAEYLKLGNLTDWFSKHINEARNNFLLSFASIVYERDIKGSTAEVGVYRGDFAKEINRVFPDRRLYLFDTFEGFPKNDLDVESNVNPDYASILHSLHLAEEQNYLKDSNARYVINKLPYPENCTVKQGYFPDTFDLKNETFAFVNLDTDLYQPIKAGLEIFYPLMSRSGIILIHDYFGGCLGVTMAVDEFVDENHLAIVPVGDLMSVAIVKN